MLAILLSVHPAILGCMRTRETPPAQPLALHEIERISDAAEQARAAALFMAYAEHRRSQGMRLRDAAIKRLRATSTLTIPEIATATGASTGTVKAVLR